MTMALTTGAAPMDDYIINRFHYRLKKGSTPLNSALTCYNLSSPILHFFRLPFSCPGNDGDAVDVRTASLLFDGVMMDVALMT